MKKYISIVTIIFLTIFLTQQANANIDPQQQAQQIIPSNMKNSDENKFVDSYEFYELFPKKNCDDIYQRISYGKKKKLNKEVLLQNYFNLKKINLNENNSLLSIFLKQRSYFYKEPRLEFAIFNSLAMEDFSDEINSIMQMINSAKTKRIVVCEYDLNKGIAEEKFFDFKINFENSLSVNSNETPKILIYYDGTIEYVYSDEEVIYAVPNFNYKKYPFDSQEFKFSITSKIYDNLTFDKSDKFNALIEETKNSNFENILILGWAINKFDVYSKVSSLRDTYASYSKHSVETNVAIERNWKNNFLRYILPVFGISFLIYVSMAFAHHTHSRPTWLSGLFFAIIVFELSASSKIPVLPYMTFFNLVILSAYGLSIVTIFLSMMESYYNDVAKPHKNNKRNAENIILYYRYYCPIIFIFFCISLYLMIL